MHRFIRYMLFLTIALLVPFVSRANSASDATPDKIQVWGSNIVRFRLAGNVPLCTSATIDNEWGEIAVGGSITADGVRNVVSLLTSAKLAGRPVTVYASNGGPYCQVTAVELK